MHAIGPTAGAALRGERHRLPPQTAVQLAATPTPASAAQAAATSASQSTGPSAWLWAVIAAAVLAVGTALYFRRRRARS